MLHGQKTMMTHVTKFNEYEWKKILKQHLILFEIKNLDPMFNLENNKIYFTHEIKITKNLKEKFNQKFGKWWLSIKHIKWNATMWDFNTWTKFELWYCGHEN